MNALSPSRRPVASPTDSAVQAPALVPVSLDTHVAANDDTEPIGGAHRKGPDSAVNPLWMITAALALFLAAMAILIST
jgi:hypothetical protein